MAPICPGPAPRCNPKMRPGADRLGNGIGKRGRRGSALPGGGPHRLGRRRATSPPPGQDQASGQKQCSREDRPGHEGDAMACSSLRGPWRSSREPPLPSWPMGQAYPLLPLPPSVPSHVVSPSTPASPPHASATSASPTAASAHSNVASPPTPAASSPFTDTSS